MMHGGKSLKGRDHPSFGTGERSKYLVPTLLEFISENPIVAEDLENMDLCNTEDEVKMTAAMFMLFLESRPDKPGADWFKTAMRLCSKLAAQKERYLRMQRHSRNMTPEEFKATVTRFSVIILDEFSALVGDDSLMKQFTARVHNRLDQLAARHGEFRR
jgi:hypothetical protein